MIRKYHLVPISSAFLLVTFALFTFLPDTRAERAEPIEVSLAGGRDCKQRRAGQRLALAEAHVRLVRASDSVSLRGCVETRAAEIVTGSHALTLHPDEVGEARSLARLTATLGVDSVSVAASKQGAWPDARNAFVKTLAGAMSHPPTAFPVGNEGLRRLQREETDVLVVLAGQDETLSFVRSLERTGWEPERAAIVTTDLMAERTLEVASTWVREGRLFVASALEQHSGLLADYLSGLEKSGATRATVEGFMGFVHGRVVAELVRASVRTGRSVEDVAGERDWSRSPVVAAAYPNWPEGGPAVALFQAIPDIDVMSLMGTPVPGGGKHRHHHAHSRSIEWPWSRATTFVPAG